MKRRRFSVEFKRKVVLEVMRRDEAIRVIAVRHGLNPNRMSKWKAETYEGLLEFFRQGKSAGVGTASRPHYYKSLYPAAACDSNMAETIHTCSQNPKKVKHHGQRTKPSSRPSTYHGRLFDQGLIT